MRGDDRRRGAGERQVRAARRRRAMHGARGASDPVSVMVFAVTGEVRSGVQGRPGYGKGTDRSHRVTGGARAAGLCVGSARSGFDGRTYELHSALLRALDTLDTEERWARGEDVFAECRVPAECLGSGLSLPVLRQ